MAVFKILQSENRYYWERKTYYDRKQIKSSISLKIYQIWIKSTLLNNRVIRGFCILFEIIISFIFLVISELDSITLLSETVWLEPVNTSLIFIKTFCQDEDSLCYAASRYSQNRFGFTKRCQTNQKIIDKISL